MPRLKNKSLADLIKLISLHNIEDFNIKVNYIFKVKFKNGARSRI